MIIKITNLRLRAIIGINEWERKTLQDIVINIRIEFDGTSASRSDEIEDTVNYKTITKKIIREVEQSKFFLLEKLADFVLGIAMEDSRVERAWVEVAKPGAVRFADSVSVTVHGDRKT